MLRSIFVLALCAGLVSEARADCMNLYCLCSGGQGAVAEVVVLERSSPEYRVRIERIHGESTLQAGDEVMLTGHATAEGEKQLAALGSDGSSGTPIGTIDAQGMNPACFQENESRRIPLDDAVAMARASDCRVQLEGAGFEEPPCCDTGCCGCASTNVSMLALFGLLARWRRSRGK